MECECCQGILHTQIKKNSSSSKLNLKPNVIKLLFKLLGFLDNAKLLQLNRTFRDTLTLAYNETTEIVFNDRYVTNLKNIFSIVQSYHSLPYLSGDYLRDSHYQSSKYRKLVALLSRQLFSLFLPGKYYKKTINCNQFSQQNNSSNSLVPNVILKPQILTIQEADEDSFKQLWQEIFTKYLYGLKIDSTFFPTLSKCFINDFPVIEQIQSVKCKKFEYLTLIGNLEINSINTSIVQEIILRLFPKIKKITVRNDWNSVEICKIFQLLGKRYKSISNHLEILKVKTIAFSNSSFNVSNPKEMLDIAENKHMKTLQVKNCSFCSDQNWSLFLNFLSSFANVHSLTFNNAQLTPTRMSLMENYFLIFEQGLLHLNLSNNQIADEGLQLLLYYLPRYKETLKTLNISNNSLKNSFRGISQILLNCTQLESLDVSYNKLSQKNIEMFLKSLGDHVYLKSLYLSKSLFAMNCTIWDRILLALSFNTFLKVIDLSKNNFNDAFVERLISKKYSFQELYLTGNSFTSTGLQKLITYQQTEINIKIGL